MRVEYLWKVELDSRKCAIEGCEGRAYRGSLCRSCSDQIRALGGLDDRRDPGRPARSLASLAIVATFLVIVAVSLWVIFWR